MNTQYTATFTLTQDGLDGEVTPSLEFNPLVNPVEEDAPAIYEYMSNVVLNFLRMVNMIDDTNQIVDDEAFEQLSLDLSVDTDTPDTSVH